MATSCLSRFPFPLLTQPQSDHPSNSHLTLGGHALNDTATLMSLFNPNAHVFTPRVQAQPTASTSQLAPPPSTGRARRPPVVRRSPVPPQPVLCKFFNTDKGCSGKCRFVHGQSRPPSF